MTDQIDKIFSGQMTQAELNRLIKMHEDYIGGIKGGKRLILQFMNLSGLSFAGHKLADAIFTGSALIHCDFSKANMDRVNLFSCDMRFANMEGASLIKADLRGVCARGAKLNNADLFQADLRTGQVLTHERSGELQALYIDVPAPGTGGQTDFSKTTMKRVRMSEAQAAYADFSDAEMHAVKMRNAHLTGANFEGANLEKVDLTGADLSQANLRDAVVMGAVMQHTKLDGANMEGSIKDGDVKQIDTLEKSLTELVSDHQLWVQTAGKEGRYLDLSGYDLRQGMNLQGYKLTAVRAADAIFIGMNLRGIELQHTFLDNANFRNAMLIQADFRGSSLKGTKFAKADLRRANFKPLVMKDGRSKPVDLTGANLRHADLREADFKSAILKDADLSYAIVDGADFTGADVTDMIRDNTDFSLAKGLTS